ncbi:tetratricopeptide repeat (TPR) protein [Trypanosoma conorhini]|uniref:Tetratricopeptide repeat (TPR) protein n=1 Tax=Trypanosoma conorhini TaxID=83891 RepID=A0A3R7MZA0_9TRYP|nr:tetratricopeptide repeat (TPR) protein [Trypanosoma conorhini]RNF13515.1 tetratricopeptide repeat (TPR) protein [Trypanosoma conorhini]
MPPRSKSKKSRKALERKEKKLLEAKIKASQCKVEEGQALLEPVGRNAVPHYAKAVAALEAAIEIYEGNASAYFLMGECYRGQEEFDKAIEYYTQCLGRDPTNARAIEGRAGCYAALQKWSIAFENYTAVIHLEPENDHIYNLRGLCTLNTRVPGLRLLSADFSQCVSDFQTAIRLNEANYYAWANLGRAYEDQGMLDEALKAYSSAVKIKEDYEQAYLRRGSLALRMVESSWEKGDGTAYNKTENTQENMGANSGKKSIPKSVKEVEEEVNLELEAAARRKHEEELLQSAIQDFQFLMSDNSKKLKWDPCLPLNLGICFLLQNDINKAEEEFKTVTEIIHARQQLVADGEAEPISNVEAIERVLNLKKDILKAARGRRFLQGKQQQQQQEEQPQNP